MKNKNESGRSLIEMLMVLGIMGVITYGAIAGISFGVDMYKANATYTELEEMAAAIKDLYSWNWPPPDDPSAKIIDVFCENDVGKRCAKGDGALAVPAGKISVDRISGDITCDVGGPCGAIPGDGDTIKLIFEPQTNANQKFIFGQLEAKNYENLCCEQCDDNRFHCIIRDY